MTPPKRWPNVADTARSNAIVQARKILRQMEPMKDAIDQGKTVSSLELSARMSRMSDSANMIIEWLAVFGPKEFRE